MDQSPLANKNIVITGASSGIGKATALTLAKAGANLILAARRELLLEEVALECERFGVKAFPYKTDVTKLDEVQNLYEFALTELEGIDIWINNAGVGAVGDFTKTPIEIHEQVIKTNLMGYLYGAYVVLPYFKDRKVGTLINNISIGGFVASPYAVAYSASKFALRGYAEALRAELHEFKNVHVCDIYPAFIDTPASVHASNFIGRVLTPAPPVYDPYKVAEAIRSACLHPRARIMVGGSSILARVAQAISPRFMGNVMANLMENYFKGAPETAITEGNLFKPVWRGAGTHGGWRLLQPFRKLLRH